MKINVSHIAKLANLPLTDEEKSMFEPQLEETLAYFEHLKEVDTKNVKPTDHKTGLENVTREDKSEPSLTQKEALLNTTSKYNGFVKVPAIFEEQ